jgi:hypothetical protein
MLHAGRRGHFGHTNVPLMLFIAVIGIGAAIAIPFLVTKPDAGTTACLEALVTGAESCPTCGKSFAIAGIDTRSCDAHAPLGARLQRAPGGPWILRQELPAWDGTKELEVRDWFHRRELEEQGGRAVITVTARGWWKWGGAFVLQILTGAVALLSLAVVIYTLGSKKERAKADAAEVGGMALSGLVIAAIGYYSLLSGWGRQEIVFEPGRVTVERRLGGWSYWPRTVYTGAGIVVIPMIGGTLHDVRIVHRAGEVTKLEKILEVKTPSLGAVGVLQRVATAR